MRRSIPRHVTDKIVAITTSADEASLLASATVGKINSCHRQIAVTRSSSALDEIHHEIERLRKVKDEHQRLAKAAAVIATAIQNWVSMLPDDVVLETVKPTPVKLLKNETLVDGIARIRIDIETAQQEMRAVRTANPPKADVIAKVKTRVQALVKRGRPKLTLERGELFVDWRDPNSFTPSSSPEHLAALLAWLHPKQMEARLIAEVDAMPEHGLVLTTSQKAERSAELEEEIERLERTEESIIELAASQGQYVERRPSQSPATVLGVVVRSKRQMAAA